MITAQFSPDTDPDSAAIRYLTNGTVSHVDLVLPAGLSLPDGRVSLAGDLLGARLKGGVAIRPSNYKTFTVRTVLCVQSPEESAAYSYALEQVGLPYNEDAIIDMIFHRTRSFSLNQKSWFCDELLYAICSAGGLQLLDTSNPLSLTPREVMLSPYWKTC
jgi:uncharacterized protein YycO